MIAVISRVTRASVSVSGDVVGEITTPGLLVLLGVARDDGAQQVAIMARKIAELRILRDEKCASEVGAPILLVSQFTLLGNTKKGRRPSWVAAAAPAEAQQRYNEVSEALRAQGLKVEHGLFGADMAVESVNDGPFTVLVHT
ncbi:D-aminoacyl-tRNA deacylase [Hoyosella sp. YIM 151337]|uniref:D-aminoacyl-tRNA deacylase n=1 Tax=Hoyosella sp. YIM 151337 TaxID=2992742 RepID=UPI002235799B|nr:D-aminoacyl-tRNA deacylase [Hoyosella sp. YIM 151337]MCW4353306.1 D-aminoacyl-tRNA deacylase [Hoyosella sp. YIM 151337]